MTPLSHIGNVLALVPYSQPTDKTSVGRKSLPFTPTTNAFVKPVKQDFVRNPRLMPGTRCMVLMLLGWAGQEQAIETTVGIIAKKLGRSVRQIHRYLKDAIEEGYLFYSRTKDRMGYYTGIKVHLNFAALKPRKVMKKRPAPPENRAMTHQADTNSKYIYKRKNTQVEQAYMDKLEVIMRRNNLSFE
ncbi:MAG: hypothetical protein AAF988_04720 [Pseudomonadota bacterium]